MGPLHRLTSLFNTSAIDVNENLKNMGVSSKKYKFSSDLDIFVNESEKIKSKAYIWTSVRFPKRKKGKIHLNTHRIILIFKKSLVLEFKKKFKISNQHEAQF